MGRGAVGRGLWVEEDMKVTKLGYSDHYSSIKLNYVLNMLKECSKYYDQYYGYHKYQYYADLMNKLIDIVWSIDIDCISMVWSIYWVTQLYQ